MYLLRHGVKECVPLLGERAAEFVCCCVVSGGFSCTSLDSHGMIVSG